MHPNRPLILSLQEMGPVILWTRDSLLGGEGIFNRSYDAPQSPSWMMREKIERSRKIHGAFI